MLRPRLSSKSFAALSSASELRSRAHAKRHSVRQDHSRQREDPVPLRRCAEQRRIVEAIESHLTRLDDAVATLERVQRNLKRYRASVLKAAVEGRLVPTEAELAAPRAATTSPPRSSWSASSPNAAAAGRKRSWRR